MLTEQSKVERFTRVILKWKYLVALIAILGAVAIGSGAQHLSFSTNYRDFFGEDNPQLRAFEEMQNVYTKDDNVLFAIEAKEGDIFTKENLIAIREMTLASWQVPYSTRVDSITNFQHTKAEEDDLLVKDLVEEDEELNQSTLAEIKNVALNDPLLINRLISPIGNITAINITFELPTGDMTATPKVASYVAEMQKIYQKTYPQFNFYLTGMVMMNNTFSESAQKDMKSLIPLMYAAIALGLLILTRTITGTFGALMLLILSIIAGMGLGGWIGVRLTPISMVAPTVILTVAVADSIHILISIIQALKRGVKKDDAIVEAMEINFQPVFLTSITTAIGFLSLNFSDTPPFHDYGNMTAMGVMTAFVLSVTFLPAIISIFPIFIKATEKDNQNTKSPFFKRYVEFLINKQKIIRIAFLLFAVGIVAFISKIELNDEFVKYFDKDISFRSDTDIISEKLTGIYTISYSLKSNKEGGISSPKYIQKMEEFKIWLAKQQYVKHVNSLSDTYKKLNKNMHADQEAFYKIPDSKELAAQYLLLYEFSLPFGLDLNTTINLDKSATRLNVTLENVSTVTMRDFEVKSNKWIKREAAGIFEGIASSPTLMFAHISERNISAMITGTILTITLVTFIMMIALGSIRFGLLTLVPNALPVIMTFGVWGLLIQRVDMSVSIIAGLTLGIVVDDSIHFMAKYLRARKKNGLSPEESIHYAFEHVGKAIVSTSIILIVGFAIVSTSSFKMNWSMGTMSAITVLFAFLADFIFLPPLLLWFERTFYKNKITTTQKTIAVSNEERINNV
ncbi:MAG: RND transporter [Planctomycetota bacterium]|nr:MAG: RND transporter [Planctomycetota bacterium]